MGIDPELSDTATTQREFGLELDALPIASSSAENAKARNVWPPVWPSPPPGSDVNGFVRRHLDVRKASFLPTERAAALTGMEYGGITPIGLPVDWPVLVDRRVTEIEGLVIGSGVRRSKILLPGALLPRLPNVEVIDGLAD